MLSSCCVITLTLYKTFYANPICIFSACYQTVFSARPGDVYACVADIGWITGHSYVVYGPLCNGVTSVLFESIPTYPNPGMCVYLPQSIGV